MKAYTFMLSLWCFSATAANHQIDCPAEIKKNTIQITSAPPGWTPYYLFEYEPGLPLNGAGLMWGPPASMTISKPTWSGKLKGKDVDRWIDLGGKESGEKWMACFYGDNGKNDAILSKQINTETTECTVTYLNKIPSAVEVICKW